MNVYTNPAPAEWPAILARPVTDHPALEKNVRRILKAVQLKGDAAVRRFTKEFDKVAVRRLEVTNADIQAAASLIEPGLKAAIEQAWKNITAFHSSQHEPVTRIETMPGITCWRQSAGIEKVGLYVPSGSAPLFSTVLMLGVPAQLAGCREIVLCSPPGSNGQLHPAILYAAQLCGITRIIKAGGVQAIAALAYGTATVPRVHKIFGPGNRYVTLAKQLVQQQGVAIDMPAGPSEVLVIADDSADARYVAADLLAQAEHGPDSQVILITTSRQLAGDVQEEISRQLELLPRKDITAKALENSRLIITGTLDIAMELSNLYAPEHLILAVADARSLSARVIAAGSVFIGHLSAESIGDYASGTNHTLPTNGYAAMYSGVSVDSFIKKITFQEVSPEGLKNIAGTVMTMAAAEGLEAHRNAVAVRLQNSR